MRKRRHPSVDPALQLGGIPADSAPISGLPAKAPETLETAQFRARSALSGPTLVLFVGLAAAYLGLFYGAEPPLFQGTAASAPTRLSVLWQLLSNPAFIVENWLGFGRARLAVLDRLPVWSVSAAILVVAWASGTLLLRAVGVLGDLSRLERLVFAVGAGLNLVSLYTLAVGLTGNLRTVWLFWGPMTAVVVAAGAYQWRDRRRSRPGPPEGSVRRPTTWIGRNGLWLAAPFTLVVLLGSVLPAWEFDVREYHLQIPKEWYAAGRVGFVPHNVYGNMPMGAEMHALLGMVLIGGKDAWWWGALVGKTIIACYALLTGLALYAAGRRFVSAEAGTAAAVIYLSIPWTAFVSMAGLIDAAWGCYLLLAVYAVLLGKEHVQGRPAWVALCGWMAGSAAACKYPAVVLVAIPLGLYVAIAFRPRLAWRHLGSFTLAAALASGLWYGKNAVLAGNPTYPLLYRVFGGETRTPEKDRQWLRAHAIPSYTLSDLQKRLDELLLSGDWNSPALWPLAGLVLLALKACRPIRPVVGLLAVYLGLWWLTTHRIQRFWVPALPLVALLAGCGAAWNTHRWWRGATSSLVILGVLLNLPWVCSPLIGDTRFLCSLESLKDGEVESLHGRSARDVAFRYLNAHVPEGSRVLLVGEAQPLDLRAEAVYNTCFDDCQMERLVGGLDRGARLAALRQSGISHVFVHWAELDRYRAPGNYGYPEFVTRRLIHAELSREQQLLRRVEIDIPPAIAELFEVVP